MNTLFNILKIIVAVLVVFNILAAIAVYKTYQKVKGTA